MFKQCFKKVEELCLWLTVSKRGGTHLGNDELSRTQMSTQEIKNMFVFHVFTHPSSNTIS